MFRLKIILIAVTLVFASNTFAKANLQPPVQDVVKMEKMAGDAGPFTTKENFPKGYLLMPKNLPFLVGLSLYDSSSDRLELSQKQIDELLKVKNTLTPKLAKTALLIKKLELEIVNEIALKHNNVKAESFYGKVDKIAKLRADMTKAHLRCIEHVKAILTDEQYEELLDYGVVNMF